MARLLLVEDSPVQRRAIQHLLEEASYQVQSVEDGRAAWESLENDELPDLVVTDLRMPELDGLALLRRIRARGWRLPVVVITEHGSEQMAAEALQAGATSYVPKTHLETELLETVEELLTYVTGDSGYEQLMACTRRAQFEFQLDNDPALIPPLIDLVQHMVASISKFADHERLQLGVAFEQALQNALFRGNLELPGPGTGLVPSPSPTSTPSGETPPRIHPSPELTRRRQDPEFAGRKIHVLVTVEPDEVRLHLQDEGPGFDHHRLLSEASRIDEGEREGGSAGRGLVLMQAFVDEIRYMGRGNEVTLTKRCQTSPPVDDPAVRAGSSSHPLESHVGQAHSNTIVAPPTLATMRWAEERQEWSITSPRITIGRERSCDIVIPHHDVSGHHCQLFLHDGWWFVSDLRTKNGIRVNGIRVTKRRLGPGDTLSVARHKLVIDYDPGALGAVGPTPPPDPF